MATDPATYFVATVTVDATNCVKIPLATQKNGSSVVLLWSVVPAFVLRAADSPGGQLASPALGRCMEHARPAMPGGEGEI